MMRRRDALKLAAAAPAFLRAQSRTRPNILMLMTDQHRVDCVGTYVWQSVDSHPEHRPPRPRRCPVRLRLFIHAYLHAGAFRRGIMACSATPIWLSAIRSKSRAR
jgi:hypothetical protein